MAREKRKSIVLQVVFWLVLLSAAAGAGTWMYLREPVIDVTMTTVQRGPVEETVSAIASGTVMPAERAMVAAGGIGTISEIHVNEGDLVKEGDLLVELDHKELDAQVALAEANLKVGESRLEQARIGEKIYQEVSATRVSQATAQCDQAESDFRRVKDLADKKAVSQSDFEKATLALRVARENKAAAEASQKETLVREEEVRSAEAAVDQLRSAISVANAALERMHVRAPFEGVIAKKILEVGEAVAMGLPLLQMVRAGECYIEAPFDEANAAQISVGQVARVELDAYPDVKFKGEVFYISPVVSMNKDLSRTFDVKVRVVEQPEKFVPGMSADVTILADRKEGVIAVPSDTLVRDEFAYVIEDGRATRRDVKLGIGNWEKQEVLEGLKEGEPIISSVSAKGLKPGVKVRVVSDLGGMG